MLGAVDEVFKAKEVAASVTADSDGFPPHIALPDAPPSVVEIWEPMKPDERNDIEGWDAPFDTVSETSPRVKLAQRIARAVRRLVDGHTPVGIDGRAARYGDVLVLVRQRGPLFEAIIRALKNEKLEVAGADRLLLTEHIAVMDLMALADALLLPQDDLALAAVLRSPLFGFSDEDLFEIAWDRGRTPLRAVLERKAVAHEMFAEAAARLDELARAARRETPFAFYAALLGAGGGRRRFLARLGPEANDALDEFLNLALDYERRETPSLQGFVAWLRAARAEVKRDMEIARDEVRVMTVHGAKGLEAPIVILADTMTPPAGSAAAAALGASRRRPWSGRGAGTMTSGRRRRAPGGIGGSGKRISPAPLRRDDARRRPADRLRRRRRTPTADRLLVQSRARAAAAVSRCRRRRRRKVFRYRKAGGAEIANRAPAAPGASKTDRIDIPQWLRQPAPPQAPRPQPLSPSSAFEEEIGRAFAHAAGSAIERRKALARGRIVHRLMQSLPDIPPAARKDAIARYLKGAAADFSPAEQMEMARQALAILDEQSFAEVFAPEAAPRCRSSAASPAPAGRRLPFPAKSTGWR